MLQQTTFKRNQGFALLEVLIAVIILAVGLTAMARLQSVQLRNISLVKQQTEALYYAQQCIEQFRSYLYIVQTTGVMDYTDIVSGSATINGANASYNQQWTVNSNTNPTYKTIAVTVSWTSPVDGTTQSVSLTSIISLLDPAASGKAMST